MRFTISGQDFISLDEELKNVLNYLTIQKYRYGDKIELDILFAGEALQVTVPKLILQPLIENSIIHGVESKVGTVQIRIEGKIVGNNIEICIFDDGIGLSPQ